MISTMKITMKAIFSPSITLSSVVCTNIILKSSINSDATVNTVINTWNQILRYMGKCVLFYNFLKHAHVILISLRVGLIHVNADYFIGDVFVVLGVLVAGGGGM